MQMSERQLLVYWHVRLRQQALHVKCQNGQDNTNAILQEL